MRLEPGRQHPAVSGPRDQLPSMPVTPLAPMLSQRCASEEGQGTVLASSLLHAFSAEGMGLRTGFLGGFEGQPNHSPG